MVRCQRQGTSLPEQFIRAGKACIAAFLLTGAYDSYILFGPGAAVAFALSALVVVFIPVRSNSKGAVQLSCDAALGEEAEV